MKKSRFSDNPTIEAVNRVKVVSSDSRARMEAALTEPASRRVVCNKTAPCSRRPWLPVMVFI